MLFRKSVSSVVRLASFTIAGSSKLNNVEGSKAEGSVPKIGIQNCGLVGNSNLKFYTANLDLTAAADMMKHSDKHFSDAIKMDIEISDKPNDNEAEYLARIAKSANTFLSTGDLVGRFAEKRFLVNVLKRQGAFVMMSGPMSVGKSLLVSNVIADLVNDEQFTKAKGSLVKIDGRENPDFVAAVNSAQHTTVEKAKVMFLKQLSSFKLGADLTSQLSHSSVPFKSPAQVVAALASGEGSSYLIIEEVNLFLDRMAAKPDKPFKEMFDALVLNTKQLNKMSVLMVFTDMSVSSTMLSMHCNVDHISHVLAVGEPSPQETLDWLKGLGVGPHLRELVVNVFGGHVYRISEFLEVLPDRCADEHKIVLNSKAPSEIANAVASWVETGGSYEEVRGVLCELARTGFFATPQSSKLARVLTETNVCSFIVPEAVEYHVDPAVRRRRAGLTPAGQATRMHIAAELESLDHVHSASRRQFWKKQ